MKGLGRYAVILGTLLSTSASALELIPISGPMYERRPTFTWRSVEGATQYSLQIADNDSFVEPIIALPMEDTSYTPALDLPLGSIYWRVRADDGEYSSSSFVILDIRIPILVPYTPELTLERRPSLHWHPVPGASSYTVEIYATGSAVASVEDFESGGFGRFAWTHEGDADWTVTDSVKYEGTYSARSGDIGNSDYSTLELTRTCVAGTISFYRKVSSESSFDYLKFYIDGSLEDSWSGAANWARESYSVAAGTHTFQWKYSKDASVSANSDAAWIDLITFPTEEPSIVVTVPVTDTFYQCASDLPHGGIIWKVSSDLVDTYSAPDVFQILTDTVPFLYRFSGDSLDTRTPVFRWHPVPGATNYTIAISSTADFSSPVLVLPVTDTLYTPAVVLDSGTYYWRVSSNRNDIYATPDRFVLPGDLSAGMAQAASLRDGYGLRLLNRSGTLEVRFNVASRQKPVLYLYRQDGRLVRRMTMPGSSGIVDLGAVGTLPAGSYIAVMKAGDAVFTQRALFIK